MREPGEIAAALPRPGPALKAVLGLLAAFAVIGAVVVHWIPGGETGAELYSWLAFQPTELLRGGSFPRFWTLVTSGLLTAFDGIGHLLWSLLSLYFFAPDLERRWGGARLIRFFLVSVLIGNLTVLAGTFLPIGKSVFHPPLVVGPFAAITAAIIAWTKEHARGQVRLMFFLPISARTLFWVTVGGALLSIVFVQGTPEGALAPLGGVFAGLAFSGSPSPVRALWLRLRLRSLRRGGGGITVEDLLDDGAPRPRTSSPKRSGGKVPALRILQGGLEEDLKNRKMPKDKRYLN
jgi:membrane associated rhomboid family serine protease